MPDSLAAVVVAEMLTAFRSGAFARGVAAGVEALAGYAAAVPWDVAFASAVAAREAGPAALGRVARLRGTWRDGALVTDAGAVALRFPPHWHGAVPPYREGEGVELVGRVASVTPLAADVLGPAPARALGEGPGEAAGARAR